MNSRFKEKRHRLLSGSLYSIAKSKGQALDQFIEALDPTQAKKMGHSGWIGYDMFCEYSELIQGRNSRILSQRSNNNFDFTITDQV